MIFTKIIIAFAALALSYLPVLASQNYAFVVGVNQYTQISGIDLQRAKADADAIDNELSNLGFDVVQPDAVDRDSLIREFYSFVDTVEPGSTVVFYFSGHGIAHGGRNFLLPSDMPPLRSNEGQLIQEYAFDLENWLTTMQGKSPALLVAIVDACRNDPFAAKGKSIGGTTKGFVPVARRKGRFVMSSAGSGQMALESLGANDTDPNSLYTRVLLSELKRNPTSRLVDIALAVGPRVAAIAHREAGHAQDPDYYDKGSSGRFCITGVCPKKPRPQPKVQLVAEVVKDIPAALPKLAALPKPTVLPKLAAYRVQGTGDGYLAVRKCDKVDCKEMGRLSEGQENVFVDLKRCNSKGWCWVRSGRLNGWVAKRYLARQGVIAAIEYRRVDGTGDGFLNVRSSAPRGEILGSLDEGTVGVEVLKCHNVPNYKHQWCKVEYEGMSGFAYSKYLK